MEHSPGARPFENRAHETRGGTGMTRVDIHYAVDDDPAGPPGPLCRGSTSLTSLWTTLIPLTIGSAVVPVQIVITIALLRSSLRAAASWVAGMAAIRLLQGVLFGWVFSGVAAGSADSGPGIAASVLLLVIAVLLYATAAKQAFAEEDIDAPPPRWMKRVGSMTPLAAFGFGAGYVAISPKFWVFTLGAIGAIEEANMTTRSSVLTFVVFVTLALSINLAIVCFAAVSPSGSADVLGRFADWISDKNRVITIILGAVFGTWFLFKALSGFGLI